MLRKNIKIIDKFNEDLKFEDSNKIKREFQKYYINRFIFFHKYNDGIILNKEAWYSVTPEKVSEYISKICSGNKIIDFCCGVGGNTIHFSNTNNIVFSFDINIENIIFCKHNLKVYNRKNNVKFFEEDILNKDKMLEYQNIIGKVDWIFCSPPWGGISYIKKNKFNILKDLYFNLFQLIDIMKIFSNNFCLMLPKNSSEESLLEYLFYIKSRFNVRVEFVINDIFLNNNRNCLLLIIKIN